MTTVDGEPAAPGPDGESEERAAARQELKLCKALLALSPPPELAAPLHSRIAAYLRRLPILQANDPDGRQPADLTDQELREAATIIRAIRALPTWTRIHQGTTGMRTALGGYSLDIADELDKRPRPPQDTSQ